MAHTRQNSAKKTRQKLHEKFQMVSIIYETKIISTTNLAIMAAGEYSSTATNMKNVLCHSKPLNEHSDSRCILNRTCFGSVVSAPSK